MNEKAMPISKCYKCGARLYARLGLCVSCESEELQAENEKLKDEVKRWKNHHGDIKRLFTNYKKEFRKLLAVAIQAKAGSGQVKKKCNKRAVGTSWRLGER